MPASNRLSGIGKVVLGVLIAGGCFLAGSYWAASPDAEDAESDRGKRRAAAQYQVSRSPLTMLEAVEYDCKSFDIFRKTQQAYVESPMVLMAALGAEGGKIGKLSVFQDMTSDGEQDDAAEWLREHLVATFPYDGELFEIAVVHPTAPAEQLVQIADAVSQAYYDTVVFQSATARHLPLKLLRDSLERINSQLDRQRETYAALVKDSGRGPADIKRSELLEAEIADLRRQRMAIEEQSLKELESPRADQGEAGEDATDRANKTDDKLAQRISRLDSRIEELTRRIVGVYEEDLQLKPMRAEIELLEAVQREVAIKIQHLQIEGQAPNRITAIGPQPSGGAKAAFIDGEEPFLGL